MRIRTLTTLFFLSACASGGSNTDDSASPELDDLAGRWQFEEVEERDGSTFTRGEDPGVVGDLVFEWTAEDSAEIQIRLMGLVDGVPDGDADTPEFPLTLDEDGVWLLDTGDLLVFRAVSDGETLTLEADNDDPRNEVEDGPARMTLSRITEPPGLFLGTWSVDSMTVGGQTTASEACETGNGGSVRTSIEFAVDDRFMLTQTLTERQFADDNCAQETGTETTELEALVEETAGHVALFLSPSASGGPPAMALEFDMEQVGDELTLTLTDCLPATECADGAPDELILRSLD